MLPKNNTAALRILMSEIPNLGESCVCHLDELRISLGAAVTTIQSRKRGSPLILVKKCRSSSGL